MACENMARQKDFAIEWKVGPDESDLVRNVNWSRYDVAVLAAGAGIIQNDLLGDSTMNELPVELVRGQSVEIRNHGGKPPSRTALLCGKYVSPLPDKDRVLVGATHEFKQEPMSPEEVAVTLQEATSSFFPWHIASVERVTNGFRVQSQRGKYGRRPILGRLNWPRHENAFIFTGLSSRGILYHGYYGNILADEILGKSHSLSAEDMDWWR